MDHLQKHQKTGRLSYRRAYPVELRRHIPGGHRELKVSLAASSLTEPGASERFRQASEEFTRRVAMARKAAAGAYDPLDDGTIAYLAAAYLSRELAAEEKAAWGEPSPVTYVSRPSLEQDYIESRALLADRDRGGLVELWRDWAVEYAACLGHRVDPTSEPFAKLCIALGTAACDLWLSLEARNDQTNRLDGKPTATPPEPQRPVIAQAPAPATGNSFETIAETILTSTRQPVSVTTQQAARTALRFLREAHGPITPDKLTRKAVTEWLDLLAKRPATLPLRERAMPLQSLAARYADRPDTPRLSAKTLNQHSGQIAALWRKAQSEGLIGETLPDPFKGRQAAHVTRPEEPTELSRAELAAIFALPVFTQGERPKQGRGEASYWLPLMLLWTGARPEELAQLILTDIRKDDETGRWLIRITDEGEHPVKGRRSLKTSKKNSGRRTFPIPQALIDLRFLDYVEWVRASGELGLFPRLTVKNARNHLFPSWGAWWGAYLKLHDAFPAGLNRRQSREFRHNWTTAARAAGIDREAREYIQGHMAPKGSANEGYGSKSPLGFSIDRLTYPGLDLSGIRPWKSAD